MADTHIVAICPKIPGRRTYTTYSHSGRRYIHIISNILFIYMYYMEQSSGLPKPVSYYVLVIMHSLQEGQHKCRVTRLRKLSIFEFAISELNCSNH